MNLFLFLLPIVGFGKYSLLQVINWKIATILLE